MLKINGTTLAAAATALFLAAYQTSAATLLEFDAATAGFDNEPDEISPAWVRSGFPMFNTGPFLLQDTTFSPSNASGEYYSPTAADGGLAAGTFTRGGAGYGIEFKVRPLNDIAFIGYEWPELYLGWSDDQFNYNITIDKFGGANTSGTGDIVYGRNSFSPAISGIDWSIPHTIFIGHRGSGTSSVFDFYLDGIIKSTIVDGSIARSRAGWEFLQDRIIFGDGTTGGPGGNDVAAEWYTIRVTDSNQPVIPPSEWIVNADGNWSTASNWSNGVPNSLTGISTARFGTAINAPRTVTVDADQTIGNIVFDSPQSYTIAGANQLIFSIAGSATIQVEQGTHTISAKSVNTSPLAITVANGAELRMTSTQNATGPNATLTKNGDGVLKLSSLIGHRLTVDAGTVELSNAGAYHTKFLAVSAGGAQLDIKNAFYSVDYEAGDSPLSTLATSIASGCNGGSWNGPGIGSSLANQNGYAVGIAEQSAIGVTFWNGISIDSTTVVLRLTRIGDSDLNGTVDFDDLLKLAQNYGSNGKLWTDGDSNYDGAVNFDDLLGLAQNYSQSASLALAALGDNPGFAADWALAVSLVPEPALCSAVLSVALVRRRRCN